MQTYSSSIMISSTIHPSQFPVGLPNRPKKLHMISLASSSSKRGGGGGTYDGDFGGRRMVDESMIVLRKRIHEMKMVERNYEPPSDWMDWEKRYYTSYDSDVCEVLGLLQTLLMNTRPSLAMAMLLLIVLSVPTSGIMILFHLIEASRSFLSG